MFLHLWQETDAFKVIRLYARNMRMVYAGAAGLEILLQQAASSDTGLRELAGQAIAQRRTGCLLVVRSLRSKHALRPGLTDAAARDVVFALASPETYVHLVQTSGWSPRRYQTWLGDLLQRELYG
jgi:hypothetical protein